MIGRSQLEIGCGTADFLCAQAREHPGTNFVGVDVSVKPLFKAIRTAEVHALPNITFIKGDFKQMYPLLAADTLQAVYLHFPDPHMRQRFRKHRVVAPAFLDAIDRALAPVAPQHHDRPPRVLYGDAGADRAGRTLRKNARRALPDRL